MILEKCIVVEYNVLSFDYQCIIVLDENVNHKFIVVMP